MVGRLGWAPSVAATWQVASAKRIIAAEGWYVEPGPGSSLGPE